MSQAADNLLIETASGRMKIETIIARHRETPTASIARLRGPPPLQACPWIIAAILCCLAGRNGNAGDLPTHAAKD